MQACHKEQLFHEYQSDKEKTKRCNAILVPFRVQRLINLCTLPVELFIFQKTINTNRLCRYTSKNCTMR